MKKIMEIAQEEVLPNRFVFLGGTVNASTWREALITKLEVEYFNPVVKDWSPEDVQRENIAKANAAVRLYVITPKQHGAYVYVEMTANVFEHKSDQKVVIVFLDEDAGMTFDKHQISSNKAIINELSKNPEVEFFDNLNDVATFINSYLG